MTFGIISINDPRKRYILPSSKHFLEDKVVTFLLFLRLGFKISTHFESIASPQSPYRNIFETFLLNCCKNYNRLLCISIKY